MTAISAADLVARESIRDLVARYNTFGDGGRFGALWPLFTDDAVIEVSDAGAAVRRYAGIGQIRSVFEGAAAQVAGSAPGGYVRHHLSNHVIDISAADEATGTAYFNVVTAIGLDHWGRYQDRYARGGDGTWRFSHRKVRTDGYAAGSLFLTH